MERHNHTEHPQVGGNEHRERPIMRMMSHISRRFLHHAHGQIQQYGLYPGQPSLLFTLAKREGQSQKELAEELDIKPATLTVMLNRMEKNGLVRRAPDEQDQRVSRIYLTDEGRVAMLAARETMDRMEQLAIAGLSEEEIATLRHLLQRIKANIKSLSHEQNRMEDTGEVETDIRRNRHKDRPHRSEDNPHD